MFPWESDASDGHDDTTAPTGWSEQHISVDVANALWEVSRVVDDPTFDLETMYPVLREVSRWIMSRGDWTKRGFEVFAMGGPDESLGKVDNSLYFNAASKLALQRTVAASKALPGPTPAV